MIKGATPPQQRVYVHIDSWEVPQATQVLVLGPWLRCRGRLGF